MNTTLKSVFISAFMLLIVCSANAQANLTIENNSQRAMTVKVMKGYSDKGTLHETVFISANGSKTIYFSKSGYYFVKTKAVLNNREPIYQKGEPFRVVNDDTGYSVMTLTFSIKESTVPQVLGGKQISKSEFEQN